MVEVKIDALIWSGYNLFIFSWNTLCSHSQGGRFHNRVYDLKKIQFSGKSKMDANFEKKNNIAW